MNAITRYSEGVNLPGPGSVAFYDDKKFLDVSRIFHLCDDVLAGQCAEQENCAEKFFNRRFQKIKENSMVRYKEAM